MAIEGYLRSRSLLTVRPNVERQPVRVVLDSRLRIPLNCSLVKTAKKTPTVLFTTQKNLDKTALLRKKEARVVKIRSEAGKCSVKAVLNELAKRGVQQILIEGGKEVLTSFIKKKLADEIVVYTSNKGLKDKGRVRISKEMKKAYNYIKGSCYEKKRFDTDLCFKGFLK